MPREVRCNSCNSAASSGSSIPSLNDPLRLRDDRANQIEHDNVESAWHAYKYTRVRETEIVAIACTAIGLFAYFYTGDMNGVSVLTGLGALFFSQAKIEG
ncbi:MAG: hypothetical protein HZB76_06720 [Chlamydiae bacterium]|nr:hypothetical protein [Chlamydiota bacterium]